MKKMLLVAGLVLSNTVVAGVCNSGSLKGSYNFNLSGVNTFSNGLTYSLHDVGRITFDGANKASFSGVESIDGTTSAIAGSGSYSVNSACISVTTLNWSNGISTTVWIYLDHMDNIPATRLAYHGNVIYKSNNGMSGSGTIDNIIGKF